MALAEVTPKAYFSEFVPLILVLELGVTVAMVLDLDAEVNPALESLAHTYQPLPALVETVALTPVLVTKADDDSVPNESDDPDSESVNVGATVADTVYVSPAITSMAAVLLSTLSATVMLYTPADGLVTAVVEVKMKQ